MARNEDVKMATKDLATELHELAERVVVDNQVTYTTALAIMLEDATDVAEDLGCETRDVEQWVARESEVAR